jgi:hypothetical protein
MLLEAAAPLVGHAADDCVPPPPPLGGGGAGGLFDGSGVGVTAGGVVEPPPPPPPQAVNESEKAAIAATAKERTIMRFTNWLFPGLGALAYITLYKSPSRAERRNGCAPLYLASITRKIQAHGAFTTCMRESNPNQPNGFVRRRARWAGDAGNR